MTVNTSVDRRRLLGGSALAMLGMTGTARAQEAKDEPKAKAKAEGQAASRRVRVSQAIADFVTGFDLKTVPQPVIERARAVFIDTVGVMLAGSHEEASHLVVAMVKAEGSAPQASIAQESLRASPQLAALANGVAAHAMDYDFTFHARAGDRGADPGDPAGRRDDQGDAGGDRRGLHHRRRGRGPLRAQPTRTGRCSTAGIRPAWSACSARRRPARG